MRHPRPPSPAAFELVGGGLVAWPVRTNGRGFPVRKGSTGFHEFVDLANKNQTKSTESWERGPKGLTEVRSGVKGTDLLGLGPRLV